MRSAWAAMRGSWVTMSTAWPHVLGDLVQQPGDLVRRARIQVPGRFVGEDQHRVGEQRARDRHALLLPRRKLVGPVAQSVAQADLLQPLGRLLLSLRAVLAVQKQRQRGVIHGVEDRDQVEKLEDEADLAATQLRQRIIRQAGQRLAVDQHAAL